MNCEKLSREQVPEKFAEWLLGMGCPPEKVPSIEKISEICRGQYYMVWRSLMEHVEPKDVIRQKRLQVFCDDVQKWQKKSPFNEHDINIIMPEPLALWQQQTELRDQVADMEARVCSSQEKLKQLTDKISMKLSQRNTTRDRIEALQRRAWLLQQVTADLRAKKENLEETRTIADSLCCFDEESDVQNKLEKCMSVFRKQMPSSAASTSLLASNPVASSSVVSTNGDHETEEYVTSLVSSRGDALWPLLCERRAAIVSSLSNTHTTNYNDSDTSPQSVLAHTAALHSSLALEAMKNRVHTALTRKRLAAALNDLSKYLSEEACELVVVRCERARAEARARSLRALSARAARRAGAFRAGGCGARGGNGNIAQLDNYIESKRDELKRTLTNLAATEKKILNIRECLIHIFNGFQKDLPVQENDRFRGHLEFPPESIMTVRQFYEERRDRKRNRVELSLDLDVSEGCSFNDPTDNNTNPTFIDELRIYLKKFCLENNRKLVLDSGEKIWIFETLRAAVSRLLARWQHDDIPPLLCVSVCLSHNIRKLLQLAHSKETMEKTLEKIESGRKLEFDIDLQPKKNEEAQITDKIKKRLHQNMLSLQRTVKTLDLGRESLNFWSDNEMKKYISPNRRYEGKTYKDYEALYIETLSI
ncbi:uncharacterized protein LOC128679773 [Plodia interpunctella]|uniref:uncharacterized protein LOC128679773 n=1 Tax=Plodia interpunctella TaxID=58824 RepID=UPI0023687FA4|nr:uncharacterized protein LOC128679773 [Plodia interpunctella]